MSTKVKEGQLQGVYVGISAMWYAAKAACCDERLMPRDDFLSALSDKLNYLLANPREPREKNGELIFDHREFSNLVLVHEIISTVLAPSAWIVCKRRWEAEEPSNHKWGLSQVEALPVYWTTWSLGFFVNQRGSFHEIYDDADRENAYQQFLYEVEKVQVKWVYVGYLRQLQVSGIKLPRCQEIPKDQCVVGSKGLPRFKGAYESKYKKRFTVSHPWLTKAHPDPDGKKLRMLLEELNNCGASDDDAVFIDFSGLTQNPRQGDERDLFEHAKKMMHYLYSTGSIPVIVLAGPFEELQSELQYVDKGWCFFEFCLALGFDNIVNVKNNEVSKLIHHADQGEWTTVAGFTDEFEKKTFTDKGDAQKVITMFENTIQKKSIEDIET